ncbi:hypothetical protein ACRE_070260 [Hapsidospora chrysogenum ATCC 11550]|uniref:Uncharacterized protein n=1 Tax=Hapsidospora chrysogenum (strain ATCC 11550 / CBS 779.69 / DSM 880 / IAM 14645 / JCM 23072 / IMI 49137) TaxID=857340 RepID=A0A086SYP0_HAPC1|nr:hypothetical protein ACRE_070260 [Hapsidospora chrysogenum ATCC 11550]
MAAAHLRVMSPPKESHPSPFPRQFTTQSTLPEEPMPRAYLRGPNPLPKVMMVIVRSSSDLDARVTIP